MLLESVFQMYVEYVNAGSHVNGIQDLAHALFDNDPDWNILETEDKEVELAKAMSNDDQSANRPSAAHILRRTFTDA